MLLMAERVTLLRYEFAVAVHLLVESNTSVERPFPTQEERGAEASARIRVSAR